MSYEPDSPRNRTKKLSPALKNPTNLGKGFGALQRTGATGVGEWESAREVLDDRRSGEVAAKRSSWGELLGEAL